MGDLARTLTLAMLLLAAGQGQCAMPTPAEKYCELWNKERAFTGLSCEARNNDAVFTAIERRADEIWGRYEFSVLRRAIGRAREDDDGRVTVVLKTSDGLCRRISKELPSKLRVPAEKEWQELGEPIQGQMFWHKKVWDAAPKEKCGEAKPGYKAQSLPELSYPKPGNAADWVCRVMVWNEWRKGCEPLSDKHILAWNLEYSYAPGVSGEALSMFEWLELSPTLFSFWAVEDFKKLDAISVRLKNGKCKTVSREMGVDLDQKWMQRYKKDGTMSQDAMMTSWFSEGWSKVPETECPQGR